MSCRFTAEYPSATAATYYVRLVHEHPQGLKGCDATTQLPPYWLRAGEELRVRVTPQGTVWVEIHEPD